jgi:hypothetical protein
LKWKNIKQGKYIKSYFFKKEKFIFNVFRIQEIQNIIDSDRIDIKKLRNFVCKGCPNESGFRSLIWKVRNFRNVKWNFLLVFFIHI